MDLFRKIFILQLVGLVLTYNFADCDFKKIKESYRNIIYQELNNYTKGMRAIDFDHIVYCEDQGRWGGRRSVSGARSAPPLGPRAARTPRAPPVTRRASARPSRGGSETSEPPRAVVRAAPAVTVFAAPRAARTALLSAPRGPGPRLRRSARPRPASSARSLSSPPHSLTLPLRFPLSPPPFLPLSLLGVFSPRDPGRLRAARLPQQNPEPDLRVAPGLRRAGPRGVRRENPRHARRRVPGLPRGTDQ